MNIEKIARTGFILKMQIGSTGYFSLVHKLGTIDCHAVAGDHLHIKVPINWGENKITIEARDPIYVLQKDLHGDDVEKTRYAKNEVEKIPRVTSEILDAVQKNEYVEGTVDTGSLKLEWIELYSDDILRDGLSQELAKKCVNLTIRNGEKHHIFFTYPINLSTEYLAQQKMNMFYE